MISPAGYEDCSLEPSSESSLTPSLTPQVHGGYHLLQTVTVPMHPSGDTFHGAVGAAMLQQQSSLPSLFQSGSERPRFFVPYRWWEDEATTVLWTFDIQDIRRVVRYGLFHDHNLPRTVLQSRNSSTVDDFLMALLEPEDAPFVTNLSHMQKVEEILRRFKTNKPPPIPWSWFPSQAIHQADALAIAEKIDAESHLQFKSISFEEWVRYSLGYPASSVEWFFLQHTAFFIHLSNHFDAYPDEIDKYMEVEKHLRTRSPFAHRALAQYLLNFQTGDDHDMPVADSPGFEFIAGPIQKIFRDHPPSLTSILKTLSVLAIRFRRTYVHTPEMDWRRRFDTAVPFLEDLSASISPADLARTLTNSDEMDFAELSREDIIAEDALVERLLGKWHALSTAVWECCTALPDLTGYVQECVQALHLRRNYNSSTAILNGLQNYKIANLQGSNMNTALSVIPLDPMLPSDILYLLDASENYVAYRQQMQQARGIPFLLPHIREFRRRGVSALNELFQGMQEIG